MPTVTREKFEEMVTRLVQQSGLPDHVVREEALAVARKNGVHIEEPDTSSFLEHLRMTQVEARETAVIHRLHERGLAQKH